MYGICKKWLRSMTAGAICLLAALIDMHAVAAARGGLASENPLAAEHVDALPTDIRRAVAIRKRACGNKAAAAHYFSVSIEAGGRRFVSLHFEDFVCANRAAVCVADRCLHEVYLESHGRYRIVFRTHASDLKLINAGAAGIEVTDGTSRQFFRWNGRRFVSVRTIKNGW
ncbi:hypothetical protein [Nitrobacter hamburgensis]|nr:hypothetical protein [Nitrobacter hamburgensis]